MFMSELTGWSHVVVPGTSYLERDGTFVNLEGRAQRLRRAVQPAWEDELAWLSALCARFGVDVSPWPDVSAIAEPAPLPPAGKRVAAKPPRLAARARKGGGLELVRYRSLFSGPAVERVPELQFQRPSPEVEIAYADARALGVVTGEAVAVSSNGASRELQARVNRRLRPGVVRIATDHTHGLGDRVEVVKA
jgi:predicted molibdopterin-dependent oxidoreductase YjgC